MMSKFNWEDFDLRVADYVREGMPRQDAELQVQLEMEEEYEELNTWMDAVDSYSPFETVNS